MRRIYTKHKKKEKEKRLSERRIDSGISCGFVNSHIGIEVTERDVILPKRRKRKDVAIEGCFIRSLGYLKQKKCPM